MKPPSTIAMRCPECHASIRLPLIVTTGRQRSAQAALSVDPTKMIEHIQALHPNKRMEFAPTHTEESDA